MAKGSRTTAGGATGARHPRTPASGATGVPGTAPRAVVVADVAGTTYRHLRLAVVALAVLLLVALGTEILSDGGRERFGSISGYYYSPVRDVLVGSLVATGVVLLAIRGRRGWEETLLTVAGMLAPVVALVPTPVAADRADGGCPAGATRCLPPGAAESVESSVLALIVVGALVLAAAVVGAVVGAAHGRPWRDPAAWGPLVAASLVWAAAAVPFWFARDAFLAVGHYAAAVAFFACTAALAYVNGRRVAARQGVPLMPAAAYARCYRAISALMALTLVAAGAYYLVTWWADREAWSATVFTAELVLVVLFTVFWGLQTAENWRAEAVIEEAGGGAPAA
ncbi:hypothetical protein [Georgenia faecalis]|uniref:hypothetical protein n=1 Tax=Georgenia faecalis TaxID=2483799 RepID=UPI000FDA0289|nr:hypothetical protein [Georgenia faecalis]